MMYKIIYILFRSLALLPFRMLYVLSDMIYAILYYVLRYRRKVVDKNVRNSFPMNTEREIKDIRKGFYHHLADCIVETVKLLDVTDSEMRKRVEVKNSELIERMADDGKSIILFMGHYGNWEWVQEITRRYKKPGINGEIYRHAKNKVFNRLIITLRSRFGTMQIEQKKAVRTLLSLHREGKQFLVGFISDQRPNSSNLNHWLYFLNQETAIAVGGEEIGKHIGANYVYLDIEKPSRGHYVLTFKEIIPHNDIKDEYPVTAEFYRMFEQTIKRDPAYWLWSHDRWKFKRQ